VNLTTEFLDENNELGFCVSHGLHEGAVLSESIFDERVCIRHKYMKHYH